VRPHADDFYLGVAAAIIVVGAVVATLFLRRFDHRPRVGGAIVAVMVLLMLALALAPGRVSDVAARNVRDTTALRDGPLHPPDSTVPWPAPPMRRVPIPTTGAPPAPPAGGAGRAPSAPPPSTTTP